MAKNKWRGIDDDSVDRLIGAARRGKELTEHQRDVLLQVARNQTPVVFDNSLRDVYSDTFPDILETAINTEWNVAVRVVDLVTARTPADAVDRLMDALRSAGFEVDDSACSRDDAADDAFVSDTSRGLSMISDAMDRSA